MVSMFWVLCVCCVPCLSGVAIQAHSDSSIFVKCNDESLDETSSDSLNAAKNKLELHAKNSYNQGCGQYQVHCIGGGGYGWVFSVAIVDATAMAKSEVWIYSKTAPKNSNLKAAPPTYQKAKASVPSVVKHLTVRQKMKLKREAAIQVAIDKAAIDKWTKQVPTHKACVLQEHGKTYAVKYYHVGVGLSEHKLALVNALSARTNAVNVQECLAGSVRYNVPAKGEESLEGFDVWAHMDANAMHGFDTVVMEWKVWEAHFYFQAMLKALLVQQSIRISHGDMQLSNMMQAKDSNEIIIFDYDTIENLRPTEKEVRAESLNAGKDFQCLYNEDDWMFQHIPAFNDKLKENEDYGLDSLRGELFGWVEQKYSGIGKEIEFGAFKADLVSLAERFLVAMETSIGTLTKDTGIDLAAQKQFEQAKTGLEACKKLDQQDEDYVPGYEVDVLAAATAAAAASEA